MKKLIGTLVVGASALAFCGASQAGETKAPKDYAPGQVKPNDSSAQPHAPGQMQPGGKAANEYAPGQRGSEGSSEGTQGSDKSTGSSNPSGKRY